MIVGHTDWSMIANRARAETFVRHIERHAEIGSTNDRALELAADRELPTPALVMTAAQSSGRGRSANVWRSSEGALTFSLVVERPLRLPAERVSIVSLFAGLAMRRSIAALLPHSRVQVKWPNDVYVNGRKVCGILAEIPSSAADRIVLGVGINVNNSLADAPADVRERAISMAEAAGGPFEIGEVFVGALIALEQELSRADENGQLSTEEWSRHCFLSGRTVQLRTSLETVIGYCVGVTESGELRLQTETGEQMHKSGEIVAF